MHHVYVLATDQGEARLASGRTREAGLLAAHKAKPDAAIRVVWEHKTEQPADAAMLVKAAYGLLDPMLITDGWTAVPPKRLKELVLAAEELMDAPAKEEGKTLAIQAIIDCYDTTQRVIARVAGVHPATVTRWLAGELEINWTQLHRLRNFALLTGLPWDDDRIFVRTDLPPLKARRKQATARAKGTTDVDRK